MMTETLVKVLFNGPSNELSGDAPELMWAAVIGERQMRRLLQIRNSPFYTKGISYLDEVLADPLSDAPKVFQCVSVTARSGHSTYRIIPRSEGAEFWERWKRLESLGCTYEVSAQNDFSLYAVDVPPTSDIFTIYEIMTTAEEEGIWQFEEGHCGHPAVQASK